MRSLMPALAEHGLTPERLAETAARLGRAAAALDHYAGALLGEHFRADRFGVVTGSAAALAEAPEEVGLRALALLLQGGRRRRLHAAARPDRGASRATSLRSRRMRASSGRCTASCWPRARTADGAPRMGARRDRRRGRSAGATLVWDRRFRVEVPAAPRPEHRAARPASARLRSAAADRRRSARCRGSSAERRWLPFRTAFRPPTKAARSPISPRNASSPAGSASQARAAGHHSEGKRLRAGPERFILA